MDGYTYEPHDPNRDAAPTPDGDPTTPLVPQRSRPDTIQAYTPRRRIGWVVAGVAIVVLAVIAGLVIHYLPPRSPAETTPATTKPSPSGTATRTGGLPFVDSNVTGYWKITHTSWDAGAVHLTVEITVDTGLLHYDFYAYDAQSKTHDPVPNSKTDLVPGFLSAGQSVVGTLTFADDPKPMSLVLIANEETQLSALPIPT